MSKIAIEVKMVIVVFVNSQYGDEYKSMNGQRINLESFSFCLGCWSMVPGVNSIVWRFGHICYSIEKHQDSNCMLFVHFEFVANYREVQTGSDFWSVR